MRLYMRYWIKNWVKIVLPFCLFTFLPLPVASQGLPLIRNYTAAEKLHRSGVWRTQSELRYRDR